MTEHEFKKQVWRAYDTIEVEGFDRCLRVVAVHFPKLSVRVAIAAGVFDWFTYDQIVSHHSATDNPDDLAIIEDLHNKVMAADKRNSDLQNIVNIQNEKIKNLNDQLAGRPNNKDLTKLRKSVDSIYSTIGSIDHRMKQIDEYLNELGVTAENP